MKKPIVLTILDGFGINKDNYGNAINTKTTPNISKIFAENPITEISASGMEVGLPEGQMGNSEVGHTNIGAGRVVCQELTKITRAIKDGSFFKNEVLLNAILNCKEYGSSLHLMGLVSDGGVHSHNTHIYALLELAKKKGIKDVFVHCFMDGRDSSPTSGIEFINELADKINEIGVGTIATISGRYYAMDREKRFERVEKVYSAMVYGEGEKGNATEVMENFYKNEITDEFIIPTVCENSKNVKENDSIIFFNFRPDRAREITRAFVDEQFNGFERRFGRIPVFFVCMTQYDALMPNVSIAFKPQSLDMPFGEIISKKGLKQLRIAEYTKYAHVTFFFNGGVEKVYNGEDRILIDSPDVATFDLMPEMSAYKVAAKVVEKIDADAYDVIVINFANCDMVGHTGIFKAAEKAVIAVDNCVKQVFDAVMKKDGIMIITADHGNADQMFEKDGSPFTEHTTNPVPFCVVGYPCKLKEGGKLADIAPTMLEIMGIEKPDVMDGTSLLA